MTSTTDTLDAMYDTYHAEQRATAEARLEAMGGRVEYEARSLMDRASAYSIARLLSGPWQEPGFGFLQRLHIELRC